MKNLKSLIVGDKVVVYDRFSTRVEPREYVVTKLGKKYIHVGGKYGETSKFNIDTGCGEYGQSLFPGNINEYSEHVSLNEYRMVIKNKLNEVINKLSKDDLDNIMRIFDEKY